MLDAHQLLIEYGIKSMGEPIIAFSVEKLLKQVQKDAYNCGLEIAAEKVKLYKNDEECLGQRYCLEAYDSCPIDTDFEIDRGSILELKI